MTNREFDRLFPSHYAVKSRLLGDSCCLRGDVTVLAIFVSDTVSRWTPALVQAHDEAYRDGLADVERQAKEFGVPLRLRYISKQVTVNRACKGHGFENETPSILSVLGFSSMSEMQLSMRESYHCDELAVVFVLNRELWPYAMPADQAWPLRDECALLDNRRSGHAIAHEMLHLFGAVDQYYPDTVRDASHRYLPGSIMCDNYKVDSLTRYLIGWADEPDEAALQFLRATRDITYDRYCEALREVWKTLPQFE